MSAFETLENFDEKNLPDLDTVVLGALEFFAQKEIELPQLPELQQPLVVGSVNAATTGRLLFENTRAVFANGSTYKQVLNTHTEIEEAVVVSASGGKHSIAIVQTLLEKNIATHLFTNNPAASAAEQLDASYVHIFPKIREPYTYNTSTYMSMLIAQSGEDPGAIHDFLMEEVVPRVPETLHEYDSFLIMIPEQFAEMHDMFVTKFDELFGPKVSGRVFTLEQAKHAKTVVSSEKEYFISIGAAQTLFGEKDQRVHIPLPAEAGLAAMMAVGYFVIGNIQKQHPPYFKEGIAQYVDAASEIFGQKMSVIVE